MPQETHQEAGCFPDRMSFHFLPLIDMARNNQLVRINTESRQMGTSKHPDTALVKPVNYTKDRRERLKIILRFELSDQLHTVVRSVDSEWETDLFSHEVLLSLPGYIQSFGDYVILLF